MQPLGPGTLHTTGGTPRRSRIACRGACWPSTAASVEKCDQRVTAACLGGCVACESERPKSKTASMVSQWAARCRRAGVGRENGLFWLGNLAFLVPVRPCTGPAWAWTDAARHSRETSERHSAAHVGDGLTPTKRRTAWAPAGCSSTRLPFRARTNRETYST